MINLPFDTINEQQYTQRDYRHERGEKGLKPLTYAHYAEHPNHTIVYRHQWRPTNDVDTISRTARAAVRVGDGVNTGSALKSGAGGTGQKHSVENNHHVSFIDRTQGGGVGRVMITCSGEALCVLWEVCGYHVRVNGIERGQHNAVKGFNAGRAFRSLLCRCRPWFCLLSSGG